jgi:drug/metabolite transporter (DMT)-like permease
LKGFLSLLGAFALAGTSVVAARFVSGALGTFTIAAASLLLALAALIPISWRKLRECLNGMTPADFLPLILQSLFGIFLFRMFLLTGLTRTSSVEAGILTGATPAITALAAAVLLKEAPDAGKVLGILCTVAGMLLIQGFVGARFALDHLAGNLLVLCAAGSESAFNILSRLNATRGRRPLHPISQTVLVTAIAFALCVVPALFEDPVRRLAAIGAREWLALIWYGLIVTALAFLLWYHGIRRCGAFTAAAASGVMPFVSLALSVWVLGEKAGPRQWLGGIAVALGMALIGAGGRDKKKGRTVPWAK